MRCCLILVSLHAALSCVACNNRKPIVKAIAMMTTTTAISTSVNPPVRLRRKNRVNLVVSWLGMNKCSK